MKKFTKKLTLAIVLVLACVLALTLMVACNSEDNTDDTPQTPAHTHDYSVWKNDATNHWKECATEGAKDDSTVAAHVDETGDGTCDVCGYDGLHVHSYTWTSDSAQHWQVCACGATTAKVNHNVPDGQCTICNKYGISSCNHYFEVVGDVTAAEIDWELDEDTFEVTGYTTTPGSATIKCETTENCINSEVVLEALPYGYTVTKTAEPNQFVYFYFENDEIFPYSNAYVTLGSTTVLQKVVSKGYVADEDYNYSYAWQYAKENVSNNSSVSLEVDYDPYVAVIFRAYSTDGNISIKLSDVPGASKESAIEMTKGTAYTGTADGYVYYKYTATADETIVFCNQPAYTGWGEYGLEGDTVTFYMDKGLDTTTIVSGKYNIITLEKDDTCYFYADGVTYNIKVIDNSGDTYLGYSADSAIEMTSDSITLSDDLNGVRYFKWTSDVKGYVDISITSANEQVSYDVMFENDFYGWKLGSTTELLSVGQEVVIAVEFWADGASSYTLNVDGEAATPVAHTFTVKDDDNNAVSGVTVTVGDASGTTNAAGVATLTFIPYKYEVELSDYDAKYLYKGLSTNINTTSYEITLLTEVTNTFIVKNSGTGLEGVTVKVMDGTTVVASGTTNADGSVTLTYAFGTTGNYTIAFGNMDDYYVNREQSIAKDAHQTTKSISVLAKTAYTVTVVAGTDVTASVAGLEVELYEVDRLDNETLVASGTTDASGVATIKAKAGNDAYIVKIKNLGTAYTAENGSVGGYGGSNSCTITIKNAEGGTEGGDEGGTSAATELVSGTNNISIGYADEGERETVQYQVSSVTGGFYTLTLNDTVGGSEVYNSSVSYFEPVLCVMGAGYEDMNVLEYTFYVAAGGSVVFEVTSVNEDEGNHAFTLTLSTATAVSSLSEGANLVNALGEDGTTLTFTSVEGGRFTLSTSDVAAFITNADGDMLCDATTPYDFELEAGGSLTIVCWPSNMGVDSVQYLINIARRYR